ncbi:MAG: bifunctional UDP-N-acetylglucosamine diphosphorylase/glucosamine-1-phosphate N-acetyltransferase GlmU [Elusimicrobiota bacterium]
MAAGEGTRMKSGLPKVLHEAAGDTLLGHVVRAASALRGPVGIVVGRGAEAVRKKLGPSYKFFTQRERRGSGHAVMSAAAWLKRSGGDAVVLCGDAPLVRGETLRRLAGLHRREENAVTVLTARLPEPAGYGRIVRDAAGRPRAIVEEKDASPEERALNEVNSGAYCFRAADLLWALKRLRPDNAKGEYYLTDAVAILSRDGRPAGALCSADPDVVLGVNSRRELARADKLLRRRYVERLMDEGVTVPDPDSVCVDAGARVGRDSVIYPHTFLLGGTRIGRGVRVGPFSWLKDCRVEDDAELKFVCADRARVGRGAKVGPYAHLRPGTRLGAGVHVGNFVETKNARLAPGVKANHLAYLGDAVLGPDVNVGAGVITCNYDGFQKHQTRVGAGAFIGSNANLVAPVSIGRGAVVGAGSTVTRGVPAGALALERGPLVVKKGWAASRKSKKKAR